ncbi:MAG TPA: terminase family protein [Sedimentisphaerales bacterium]|nr:terminase family protein [Sedimentisphaerales bacterium]
MSQVSLREAVKDDLRAQLRAERYFSDFCKFVDPKHPVEAPHMHVLTRKLQGVAQYILTGGKRGISRLMIFMPPRYWKSQTASRKLPAWLLGKNADLRIILTSYGADLASKHSKAARDLVQSERYAAVFGALASTDDPVTLDPESKASAAWEIANRNGGMQATGVGGGVTGFGANLLLIDDPVKGRKEANSKTQRESDYEWFKGTAYTRLEDNAAIILIMTRWDQEDLAGMLLRAMVSDPDADQWEVVMMPAFALNEDLYPRSEEEYIENLLRGIYIPRDGDQLGRKAEEPLWPSKDDTRELEKKRANMDDFEFTAQFQQMPRLAEGNFFDDKDFEIVDRAPEGLRWFRYADLALGKSESSDFNACYAVGFAPNGNLFIRDPLKVRNLDEFLPDLRMLMLTDGELGTVWGIENTAFQVLVVKEFLKDKALVNIPIMEVTPKGSKEDRARAWRLRAKQGKVKLVRGPWNQDFIRVAASFGPTARYDDDIDSVSGGVQMQAEEAGGDGRTASSEAVVVSTESLFSDQLSVTSGQFPLDLRR